MSEATLVISRKERFLKRLVRVLVRMLYRDVEVYHASPEPVASPELSVSNHFGGFADPLVLVYAFDRRPVIIARDKIWKIPIVGQVMRWLGSIPVHKREDGTPTSNDEMFASAYNALRAGQHLLIFPEGITVDDPAIAPIKTGAARIALGARASGASDIKITPAGIHYEDKAALRSRIFVNVGYALDLDDEISSYVDPGKPEDPSNRDAVRRLTTAMEKRLREVAPDFDSWEEARGLTQAAEVALRSSQDHPADAVSISERDRLAGSLGRTEARVRAEILDASAAYDRELDALGLDDRELMARISAGGFIGYMIRSTLLGALLLPFALAGVLTNVIPYLLVKGLGLLPVAAAVKATLKPLGAVLFFAIAWGVYAWGALTAFDGIWTILAIVLLPFTLAAAIVMVERARLLWRAWRSFLRQGRVSNVVTRVMQARTALLDAVHDAVGKS